MYRCYAPYGSCKSQVFSRDSEGHIEFVYCGLSDDMSENNFCPHSNFNKYNYNEKST